MIAFGDGQRINLPHRFASASPFDKRGHARAARFHGDPHSNAAQTQGRRRCVLWDSVGVFSLDFPPGWEYNTEKTTQEGADRVQIEVNGIQTSYELQGTAGLPVLILPGWGATAPVYRAIAGQLAENHLVYTLDLPGFGVTPEPPQAWSVDDYAEFVIAFVGALGLRELILFGHSYGGRIILNLCSRPALPFTAAKLVLTDSAGIKNPLTPEQQKRQDRYKKLKKTAQGKLASKLFPHAIERLQQKYGSADYAAASPVMKQTLIKSVSEDYSDRLPHVRQKTLLIWGRNDTATPLSNGETMLRLLPDAHLEVVDDAGHFPFLDQPFDFRRILGKYFDA